MKNKLQDFSIIGQNHRTKTGRFITEVDNHFSLDTSTRFPNVVGCDDVGCVSFRPEKSRISRKSY